MSRQFILTLDGDLDQQGFQVKLQVNHPLIEEQAALPPSPELVQALQQWRKDYNLLSLLTRITVKKVTLQSGALSFTEQLAACQHSTTVLGQQFSRWLQSNTFMPIDRCLRESLEPNQAFQVIIRSHDQRLYSLPWHLWDIIERHAEAEVIFGAPKFQVVSQLRHSLKKVQILAILGDSSGIDIDEDRRVLAALPDAEVKFLVEPSLKMISQELWEKPWHILFFAGHSRTEGETGRIYLNAQESLTLEELRNGLSRSVRQGLKLAIFNSCDGLGLAYALESLHLPYTMVMREPVPDRVAQAFLKHFLHHYAAGDSLYASLRGARERMQEEMVREFPCADWLPVIYQTSDQAAPNWRSLIDPESSRWVPWIRGAVISSITTGLVLAARWAGALQGWELQAYDALMRSRSDESPDPRIVMVEITEKDLRSYGHPLPDKTLAQLLKILKTAGAGAIGIDILRDLPQGNQKEHQQLIEEVTRDDRTFLICRHGQIKGNAPGTPPPSDVPLEQIGFADVTADSDDVLRRYLLSADPAIIRSGCESAFAFSLLLSARYLLEEQIGAEKTSEEYLKFNDTVFTPLEQPANGYQQADLSGHQILLNYRRVAGSTKHIAQRVTLTEVLQQPVNKDLFRDRVVLIGVTADSVKDDFKTPYGEKLRGLEVHAQMTSQILSAVQEERSLLWTWTAMQDGLWIGCWAALGMLIVGLIAKQGRTPGYIFLANGIAFIVLSGCCWVIFVFWNGWVPWVPGAIALLGSAGTHKAFVYSRTKS
jgi:CHASE2 domain-containing sensor protein